MAPEYKANCGSFAPNRRMQQQLRATTGSPDVEGEEEKNLQGKSLKKLFNHKCLAVEIKCLFWQSLIKFYN